MTFLMLRYFTSILSLILVARRSKEHELCFGDGLQAAQRGRETERDPDTHR
jgi:hypothetical protein